MPNFTFTTNVPNANDNPSDTPGPSGFLFVNQNSTSSILNVDLYGFNNNNGGFHQQLTFPLQVNQSTQSGQSAVVYTQAGTANTGSSQLFWRNSQGAGSGVPYHLSPIKAWGIANSSGIISGQSSNIISSVFSSFGTFTITMSANTVNGTNYAVICSSISSSINPFISYTITSPTVFVINGAAGVSVISFMVLQI